jgi:hypothetical protein
MAIAHKSGLSMLQKGQNRDGTAYARDMKTPVLGELFSLLNKYCIRLRSKTQLMLIAGKLGIL